MAHHLYHFSNINNYFTLVLLLFYINILHLEKKNSHSYIEKFTMYKKNVLNEGSYLDQG